MNNNNSLKKLADMPFHSLRVVERVDELDMISIRLGIIFIFAVWSGPALVALERLTKVLAGSNTSGLDLVLLDTDCLSSEDSIALWGKNVGGGGETIFIRDGQIASRLLLCIAGSEMELITSVQDLLNGPAT